MDFPLIWKMPQDAVDYFDGLLLEACHTVVDLYQ